MSLISQLSIDWARKNKSLEIIAYLIQNYLGINYQGWGSFAEDPENMHEHFKGISENYVKQLGPQAFSQKVILELGTGFSRSGMLHLIKEYDVQRVYCYDRFNCLHDNELALIKREGLEDYMDRLTYFYGDYNEIINNIDTGSIDTIISNAVLEFVTDLDALAKVLGSVAKLNSVSFHRIDLKCHNKFKAFGELYFHTFSDTLWKAMGERVGQLSRRLPRDYAEVFEKNSFECITVDVGNFSKQCLLNAQSYLKVDDIAVYGTSELDLFLTKK